MDFSQNLLHLLFLTLRMQMMPTLRPKQWILAVSDFVEFIVCVLLRRNDLTRAILLLQSYTLGTPACFFLFFFLLVLWILFGPFSCVHRASTTPSNSHRMIS